MAELAPPAGNAFGLTCARRAILRILRSERRELPVPEIEEAVAPLWHHSSDVAHCVGGLLSEVERSDLLDALRLLDPAEYEILELAYSGRTRRTDREVATILGVTKGTTKMRRSRALVRLRRIVASE